MRKNARKLASLVGLALLGIGAGEAQNAAGQLRQIVEVSARRLLLARQVGLAKWAAVEDAPREELEAQQMNAITLLFLPVTW